LAAGTLDLAITAGTGPALKFVGGVPLATVDAGDTKLVCGPLLITGAAGRAEFTVRTAYDTGLAVGAAGRVGLATETADGAGVAMASGGAGLAKVGASDMLLGFGCAC
jgi:hypothetical protein